LNESVTPSNTLFKPKNNFNSDVGINKKLSKRLKKYSLDSVASSMNNNYKPKPLFLNPNIKKKFIQSNKSNKLISMNSSSKNDIPKYHKSLCINKRKTTQTKPKRVTLNPKITLKKSALNRPKTKKKELLFPSNFIDWKQELKHNLKIKKSFERLITRGKYKGQYKRNRDKSKNKKKKKIHFYMLKKSNLVGENFIISSIEQNFLLKHIVLFSIVKNNYYYRLTKINFNYTEQDVNIKGNKDILYNIRKTKFLFFIKT
jgi:hypothetical protein